MEVTNGGSAETVSTHSTNLAAKETFFNLLLWKQDLLPLITSYDESSLTHIVSLFEVCHQFIRSPFIKDFYSMIPDFPVTVARFYNFVSNNVEMKARNKLYGKGKQSIDISFIVSFLSSLIPVFVETEYVRDVKFWHYFESILSHTWKIAVTQSFSWETYALEFLFSCDARNTSSESWEYTWTANAKNYFCQRKDARELMSVVEYTPFVKAALQDYYNPLPVVLHPHSIFMLAVWFASNPKKSFLLEKKKNPSLFLFGRFMADYEQIRRWHEFGYKRAPFRLPIFYVDFNASRFSDAIVLDMQSNHYPHEPLSLLGDLISHSNDGNAPRLSYIF